MFWLLGVDDVDWNTAYACDPIPSTQKMHFVCALNQYDVTKLIKLSMLLLFLHGEKMFSGQGNGRQKH
jgi:hypothetical protein